MVRKTAVRSSRPKPCFFCGEKQEPDYKKADALRRFVSERGKILSREKTGICRKHQKRLTTEIKRARVLSLLPFTVRVR